MFSLRVQKELDAMGLAEAQGSIRNARIIMERSRSQLSELRGIEERIRALEARKTAGHVLFRSGGGAPPRALPSRRMR